MVPITLKNPSALPVVPLYQHVSVAEGSRLVFVAGQVAHDSAGNLVGAGDLAAQVEQCYLNVAVALAAVGATLADVAKLTCYFVNWSPGSYPLLMEGIARASATLGIDPPEVPFTGLGVSALAEPDLLVEVEATAAI